MIDVVEMIGYLAGALGLACAIPQLVQVLRTKLVRDLSLTMLYLIIACMITWVVYGMMISNMVIIVCDGILVVLWSYVLVLYYKYRRNA